MNAVGTEKEVTGHLMAELQNTEHVIDSCATVLKQMIVHSVSLPDDSLKLQYILVSLMQRSNHLNGAFIAFQDARSLGTPTKLYSFYVRRQDGRFIWTHIDRHYDYIDQLKTAPWFREPMEHRQPTWISAYYGSVGRKRLTTYAVPVFLNDSSVCIIGGNYSSMDLYFLINSWKTSRIGYSYLLTRDGRFVAHPDNETLTLHEIGVRFREPALIALADGIKTYNAGKRKLYYHRNTVSKTMCWDFVSHIPKTDWFLGFSVADHQICSNPAYFNQQRRYYIGFSFVFFFILLLVSFIFLAWWRRTQRDYLYLCSLALMMFLGTELYFLYHYCLLYPKVDISESQHNQSVSQKQKLMDTVSDSTEKKYIAKNYDRWNFGMLLDTIGVNENIKLYPDSFKDTGVSHIVKIPTGLYIQTVQFTDSYSATVTGYVWQKYKVDAGAVRKGILFPDAETVDLTRDDSCCVFAPGGDKYIFLRWHFSIKIREPFYYNLYPFDQNELWVRLWHVDYDKNVILVPDFDSYRLLHPSFQPGLDHDILIPGWDVEGSYFSFKEKSYTTNFGKDQYFTKSSFPELHYNIMIQRDYLDPIITRIIPLLVLLMMAYSILYISQKEDELDVAIACSGMLFIAVFEQVNLRHNLNTEGIIYLEYYYFITYVLLMLVAINALTNNFVRKIFPDKNTMIDMLKVLFWPIFLLLVFVVSLITFY